MKRVITMTAWRRPGYTKQVLDALAACKGVGDWILLPSVEPGCHFTQMVFKNFTACESHLRVNPQQLGLNANTRSALHRGYALSADILLHLEDDVVPSPDALLYYDWAVRELLIPNVPAPDGRPLLFANGHNRVEIKPTPEQSHECSTRPVMNPWGWAVDRSRLRWLLAQWESPELYPKCFTGPIRKRYGPTHREVYPRLSRIQNIGIEGGTDTQFEFWNRQIRVHWVATTVSDTPFVLPTVIRKG